MSEQTTAVVSELVNFLNCPCTYFAPMIDDEPLMEAYQKALEESKESGDFVPVFVIPSDTLLETLVMNSDPTSDGTFHEFDKDEVKEYRHNMLDRDANNGHEALSELLAVTESVLEPEEFQKLIEEEGGNVEVNDRLFSWWNFDNGMTEHIILAKIPVERVFEIFAYLPMGGWNDCPSNENLMVISRLWYENYGAVPAIISCDSVEYTLPKPVPEQVAKDLAIKHYAFCPTLLEDSDGITISSHAEALKQSTIWYFWWD